MFAIYIIFVLPQASDLDGEIDLSTCYSVTEYQAQRNYGFQIHVRGFLFAHGGPFFFFSTSIGYNVLHPHSPDLASKVTAVKANMFSCFDTIHFFI